jgi:hypothetical protein
VWRFLDSERLALIGEETISFRSKGGKPQTSDIKQQQKQKQKQRLLRLEFLTFGGPAVIDECALRPEALRPRLSTSLPLSSCCKETSFYSFLCRRVTRS